MSETTEEAVEQIQRVRARLATAERWTKKAFARNNKNEPAMVKDESACAWCLAGAANAEDIGFAAYSFIAQAIGLEPPMRVSLFAANDDPLTTHADVLRWLDRAIDLAKKAS